MPLFGRSTKSPSELIGSLKSSTATLKNHTSGKKCEKAIEDIGKTLSQVKNSLFGQDGQDPQPEVVSQIANGLYEVDLLHDLVKAMPKLEFEAKKDLVQIFNNMLRRQFGSRTPTVDFITTQDPDILQTLIKGYENKDCALNCGLILRECIRYEALAKLILNSPIFFNFFEYVEMSTFDVASDAFSSFKELLTRHKLVAAEFLEKNYDTVFDKYKVLLNSDNYVTKRQSLKLLGELLLDRHNFTSMTRYISNPENLKLMMNMLRDKSRNIQFEAFHVFKVFVANPNKTQPILDILLKNKEKLVEFLTNFHTDRTEDEQFNDEKNYLIKQIKELQPPVPQTSS
ncbi:calcium-binding protein 39-like [Lytechinus pictus]|uniref:calcium-binding protein 39-like n=1 Tax=Lytechinus pictus TaxID=7653 RepID=UPI00240CFFA4|nr:calcium-binding protein 39-like [Lytechinus pictus]